MQLQHCSAAGLLVQSVNVLGDHRAQPSRLLQFRQFQVRGIGLGIQGSVSGPVKTVKFLGMGQKKAVAEDRFRRRIILLVIQPVHAAKVGNAAFRGDARAPKENNAPALVHHLLQGHCAPSLGSRYRLYSAVYFRVR